MKITRNINNAVIEFLAMKTIENKGKIPAEFKSQMTSAVTKMVERKVKYFKKNKAEYENLLANVAKANAKTAERETAVETEVATETPAEVVAESAEPTEETVSEN